MAKRKPIVPSEGIESRILSIRGNRVMLDADLAELFGAETRTLNQAVKRKIERFPDDFMFQLTLKEFTHLKSQSVTSSWRHGGRRTPPYVFTEHGAIMAANVLNSERAVAASVFIVRAFVKLRGEVAAHKAIMRKLAELEERVGTHDGAIKSIVEALNKLVSPPARKKGKIGFRPK